ncbi:unnamed protein product, partial [Mesorhabditis spiculigera]
MLLGCAGEFDRGWARSEAGDYPFAVTLQVYNQVKKKWLTVCAGSIIDREWVLGAANCFYFGSRRTPADQYRIVAGSTRVTSTSTDDGITQVIQVADVVIHPEMKVDDKPNDELDLFIYNELALIKLSKPLKFGKTVQKVLIPFPEKSLISKGKLVDVMAWGKTGMDEPAAEHLRYYRASIQPKKRCDNAWNYKFPSEIICLMANQFKGVCNGDWGAAAARKIQHEGKEQIVQAAEIFLHPQFYRDLETEESDNDIALVRLSQPLNFTKTVIPILVPTTFDWVAQQPTFEIAGWGRTGIIQPPSEQLMMYHAQWIPPTNCPGRRPGTETCYNGVEANSGPCLGDSGAAVAVRYRGGWWQVAVHHVGERRCKFSRFPTAYGVDATAYCDFFAQTMKRQPPHKKVVGGTVTSIETYPHAVALRVIYNGSWVHICGGSIIAPEWVLTAGHCVYDVVRRQKKSPLGIFVFAGAQHMAKGIVDPSTVVIELASIHPHPQIYEPLGENDIALVRLTSPIKYTKQRQPITIPSNFDWRYVTKPLVITGWGRTGKNKPFSVDLLLYKADLVPWKNCEPNHVMPKRAICYKGPRNVGPCGGDSGDPVATQTKAGLVQLGVHGGGEFNCDYSVKRTAYGSNATAYCDCPAICISGKRNVGPCEGDSGAAVATQYHGRWLQLGVYTRGRFDCDYSVHTTAFGVDATQNCAFYEQTIGRPVCVSL